MKSLLVILLISLSGSIFASNEENSIKWADQGWSKSEREYWHYQSLGQALIPISWFLSLERGKSTDLFSEREHLKNFGFIYEKKNIHNQYSLPIGFAVAPNDSPISGKMGLTCAACHTGQIIYRDKAIRYDGGSSNHNLVAMLSEMYSSLQLTYTDEAKWDRFVARVNKIQPIGEPELKRQIEKTLGDLLWGSRAQNKSPGIDVTPGPGRADALNRIGNFIFGQRLLVESNYHKINAPANYPFMWNIWKFNWVHYNASFTQPMARNILQVLGNSGETNFIDANGKPVDGEDKWKTSVDFRGAAKMEEGYRKLSPPQWPAEILGQIDRQRVNKGKVLFEKNCSSCHAPIPIKSPDNKKAQLAIALVPLSIIGTDPAHAKTFNERRFNLSKLTDNSLPISGAEGLTFAIDQIEKYSYSKLRLSKEEQDNINGFGRENKIRAPLAYKARTLEGIWATPPYLHNGSVPNLYELLSPVSERSKQFWTGTYEFDPIKVGYVTDKSKKNYFLFDATIDGNKNIGHEFNDGSGQGIIGKKLSHEDRMDLIEYLKVIDQNPPNSREAVPYDWEWNQNKTIFR